MIAMPKLLSTVWKRQNKLHLGCSAAHAPLAPPAKLKFTPIHTSACPKTNSTPLHVQRQQSERKDHRLFYETGISGKDRVSRNSGWPYHNLTVNLHCSHHNLNASIHDGICLRPSVSVATNSCFVSINSFSHLLMYIHWGEPERAPH